MVKIIFKGLPKLEKSIEENNCDEDVFIEKPVHPEKLLEILDIKLQRKAQCEV